jgi:hypothetical protein
MLKNEMLYQRQIIHCREIEDRIKLLQRSWLRSNRKQKKRIKRLLWMMINRINICLLQLDLMIQEEV